MAEEFSKSQGNDPETLRNLIRQVDRLTEELVALRQFLAAAIVLIVEANLTSELAQAQDGLITWAAEELDLDEIFDHLADWLPPIHAPPVLPTPVRPTQRQKHLFGEES